MVDFDKLISEEASPSPTDPTELFRSLLSADRFSYLRDVQQDVLSGWYKDANRKDTVIKMNTGAGKTVVGLLILQSSLNAGVGPALYVAPTVQLVEQVVKDAVDLGIPVSELTGRGDLPVEFHNSEKILVTTFQKLFNARSVFGVEGGTRPVVEVGALLVDDAHSCLRIAREQTTVSFDSKSRVYKKLFSLFGSALSQQSAGQYADIDDGHPWTMMNLPYWAWQESLPDVAKILSEYRDSDELKFAWNLIKDELSTCSCYFSGKRVEIAPMLVPVRALPSFATAQRRLFLSATLADDSILPKEFDVSEQAVAKTIRPRVGGDIGERMILVPELIDAKLGSKLPKGLSTLSKKYNWNVVVIVPRADDADRWTEAGAELAIGNDVTRIVEKLRSSKGNYVVLANRYDGIDLPDEACRVLVIDGLPRGQTYFDQHQTNVRRESLLLATRLAQTVEQGFGRGVRSGKDRCVVLVTGDDLVRFVGMKRNWDLFSPETRAQIEMGRKLSGMASEESEPSPIKLVKLMEQCLTGDEGWRRFHAARMAKVPEATVDTLGLKIGVLERQAFNAMHSGDSNQAVDCARRIIGDLNDDRTSDVGWFLQMGASFVHSINPTDAQQMQKSAHEKNSSLLRPLKGVQYRRVLLRTGNQSIGVLAWINSHTEPNAVVVSINELISRLSFGVDSTRFEEAWHELGTVLGFKSQMPEREFGKGPDGLWAFAKEHYLLAEAKSEVEGDRKSIHQSETEQLSNSVNWFHEEYGSECKLTPILIHPIRNLGKSAFPPEGAKVLAADGLAKLHSALSDFAAAISAATIESWSVRSVGQLLNDHQLTPNQFESVYLADFARKRR